MNKEQYIRSRFRDLLSETLEERTKDLGNRLNLGKETHLYPSNEFDYVQEGKSICEECGGMITEGECSECGWKGSNEVMESGKKLEKISNKEIEDLLGDVNSDIKKRNRDHEEFELELDEKECVECGSSYEMKEKLYGKQRNIDKNKNGKIDGEDFEMLRKQQDEEQLYEVEFEKNEFSEDSKPDFLDLDDDGNKKESMKSAAKDAKRSKHKVKESILYTESDLIDLIERLVVEEKKNFSVKEPKGYKEYEKVHKADKKENEDYLKSVAKKMTDYLKNASDDGSKYEMKETKKFPTENGGLKKGIRKKYTPSDAVDEYIDAFSYPGQTNLVYDEIKPTDEKIKGQLVGSSTNGNAQVDKDGNALGNVVPSEVGEKFYKNFKDNLYGQEQMNASYKRQSQPVDVAGDETQEGSLSSKRGKKSGKSAQSILNKLDESIEPKKLVKLNEEFDRMQSLMGYNRKTQ